MQLNLQTIQRSDFQWYKTGNSGTKIPIKDDWCVIDIGSGHNPHPRADVIVDKYLQDDTERSGQKIVLKRNQQFFVADACNMPFKDKVFNLAICSHVAEHIDDIHRFCTEMNRIAHRGYIETPSKFAEILRHAPNHRWYVSIKGKKLVFSHAPTAFPLRKFGKLFFSFYFYRNIQARERDVFTFALGCDKPLHYIFAFTRWLLVRTWLLLKPLTYTRFFWENSFSWKVNQD